MTNSRRIARIIGPALVAIGTTEALNLTAFAGNAAPVVYLNGTLLFIAGVAVVQAHNRWVLSWPILVTLSGWIFVLGGLIRMIAPAAQQMSPGLATDAVFVAIVLAGAGLTYRGYGQAR